ncbi:hypothetical protein [Streptomyces sp. NPDC056452]|uniref:hypothetical protein n=1 Tax=Streptomyces sp. NPDC056452 TaxID=3345821 RepID=UPI0036B8134D
MRQQLARRHGLLAVALTMAMGVPLLAAVPATADPAPTPASTLRVKVDAEVVKQLDKKDTTTFWVQLGSRADTSAAKKAKTRTGRDKALITAKKKHASTTQAWHRGTGEAGGRALHLVLDQQHPQDHR